MLHESTNDPKEIVYVMKKAPEYGYLKLDSVTLDPEEFKHFDQYDVNSNLLSYVETEMNATSDYFIVDVTNGITWLKHLKVFIVIVKTDIILYSKPVKVRKGKIFSYICLNKLVL